MFSREVEDEQNDDDDDDVLYDMLFPHSLGCIVGVGKRRGGRRAKIDLNGERNRKISDFLSEYEVVFFS